MAEIVSQAIPGQTKKCSGTCGKELPLSSFYRSEGRGYRGKYGVSSFCKKCKSIKSAEWNRSHPLNTKIAQKKRYLRTERKNHLARKYGITEQQYESLFDAQEGKCKICGRHVDSLARKRLQVDHNHKTDMIRGLLCYKCNLGIGSFEDDRYILSKAIEYLGQDSGIKCVKAHT